jgi:hypothetical protein
LRTGSRSSASAWRAIGERLAHRRVVTGAGELAGANESELVTRRSVCSGHGPESAFAGERGDDGRLLARERVGLARPAVLHRVRKRAPVVGDPRLGLLLDLARLLAVDVAPRTPRVEPRGVGQPVGERVLGARERAIGLRLAPGRLVVLDLGRELGDLGRARILAHEALPVRERLTALER